tara:strand:- start:277 stop:552 length:276 start_codon:yes stop_codon:yes gene_type:complete
VTILNYPKLKCDIIIKKITERKLMKKFLLISLLMLFTSSVYAGSCPMMAKKLDGKIEEAQKLRDAGFKAHESGDHVKSEELLSKAMELFKS